MTTNDYKFLPAAGDLEKAVIFAGGRLCLDFANTLCRWRSAKMELISSGEELRMWLMGAEDVYGLRLVQNDWATDNGYWRDVLPKAVSLRSALREILASVIERTRPPAAALEEINGLLKANPAVEELVFKGGGFQKRFSSPRPADAWLIEIAKDAADLLACGNLSYIRECAHPACVRIFYDATKNHRKRWCSEKCGSHTKAAAYYRRKIARQAAESIP